jgi:hypothetical protein
VILAFGCTPPTWTEASEPESGDSAVPQVPAVASGDPAYAPALLLELQLDGDDQISVRGTVPGTLWHDLDGRDDTQQAFRYELRDGSGESLFASTTRGPVLVREFLAYYSADSGFDILDGFAVLGQFTLLIPEVDGAETLALQIRDGDGVYQEAGTWDLANAEAQADRPSDAVVSTEQLVAGGDPERTLDIAIVGDGFTADELGTFEAQADEVVTELMASEPFATFAPWINVWRVDAVSDASGVSYDCVDTCAFVENAFGSIFAVEWVNEVLGTTYDSRAVFQLDQFEVARAAATVPYDHVIVIGNSSRDAGMAVHYATMTGGDADTAVHEYAHLLGWLGDEYQADACIQSDALGLPDNISDVAEAPPWIAWIEEDTPLPTPDKPAYNGVVGAFEGAYNCDGLYRPQRSCRMNDSDDSTFCAPCEELLARRIFRFADFVDEVSVTVGGSRWEVAVQSAWDDVRVAVEVDGVEVAAGTSSASPLVATSDAEEITVACTLGDDRVREDGGELTERYVFRR